MQANLSWTNKIQDHSNRSSQYISTMAGKRLSRRLSLQLTEKSEYKWISTEIERQIKRDRKKSLKEVKILVVGAAESGKSTFITQRKVIQGLMLLKERKQRQLF